MKEQKRPRGRPKSDTPPLTAAERSKLYRERKKAKIEELQKQLEELKKSQ